MGVNCFCYCRLRAGVEARKGKSCSLSLACSSPFGLKCWNSRTASSSRDYARLPVSQALWLHWREKEGQVRKSRTWRGKAKTSLLKRDIGLPPRHHTSPWVCPPVTAPVIQTWTVYSPPFTKVAIPEDMSWKQKGDTGAGENGAVRTCAVYDICKKACRKWPMTIACLTDISKSKSTMLYVQYKLDLGSLSWQDLQK